MRTRWLWVGLLSSLLVIVEWLSLPDALAQSPVARAVLFFSPTCPHCHVVLDEVLPPLQARYGDQLHILTIDVTTPDGMALYEAAITTFAVPRERFGVPALFFEQVHLVGSTEIPAQLPGLIEQALTTGGSRWPPIPGLEPYITRLEAGTPSLPSASASTSPFSRDPANTLALLVLTGMVIVIFITIRRLRWPFDRSLPASSNRLIPVFAVVGLVLAGYLAVVELSQQSAVCGPIGDCNLVHQSPYARIAGIPVGLVGVAGYLTILGAWMLNHIRDWQIARQLLVGFVLVGTLVSLYLTFLEPFVIGATCLWCLLSAITMTTLLWLVALPVDRPVMRGRRSLSMAKR